MDYTEYENFLRGKMCISKKSGFKITDADVSDVLFPHQRDIGKWAVEGGRRAIFAAFGLGKSLMQLDILRIIHAREKGRYLIIAPLGVKQEFAHDAKMLNMNIKFIRRTDDAAADGFYITNYESVRDGKLDVGFFNGISLDESAILRSYGSKTFQTFLTLFDQVKYRFVATATPSPNRFKELIHYAGFLGIIDTGQALTRFFQRDSTKANNLTLYPHMEKEFWLWLNSWAIFLQKPSDIGHSDAGYDLPKLNIHFHEIDTGLKFNTEKNGQISLLSASFDLQTASKEKRESIKQRVAKMHEILTSNPDDHFIVWHDQEAERHAIKKAWPEAVEIFGSQDLDTREKNVVDFSQGVTKYLASKPVLSGSGCNFQKHCHSEIFLGIGFKFHDFIQSVHRVYRFLQDKECNIHLIYTDKERGILKILLEKWEQHKELMENMTEIIKKNGLSALDMDKELSRAFGVERVEITGKKFIAVNNDTVKETMGMGDNSVGLIHTSIPFANHYEYTPSYNDFGYTNNNDHFWEQMDFLTPHLLRVLQPGRIAAIHIKDRILFGNVTGYGFPTCDNMLEETSLHFQKQ